MSITISSRDNAVAITRADGAEVLIFKRGGGFEVEWADGDAIESVGSVSEAMNIAITTLEG